MKRNIFIQIFIFLMTFQFILDAQTWTAQISGVSDDLKAVHFASSTVGGVVGANGAIVTTINGGASWSPQNSGTTVVLHNIYFASNSIAWAVGNSGTILHTVDGGITWIPQTSGNTKFLFDVFFVSSTTGWVVGESGIILYTTDGGNTWMPQSSGTTQTLNAVFFVSENQGWAVGNSNTVLHTADAGATWMPQTANFGSYNDVQFISGTQGWAVGWGSLATVITTTDAGNTWTNLPQPLTSLITVVNFVSPTKGWWNEASSTTSFGSIRTTTDGGVSWTSQPTPVAVATQDAFFIDAGLGWTVGNSGIILKYTDPTVGIDEDNFTEPNNFALNQNYPNPFNPTTKISWQSASSSWQTLKVYDVLGSEVATLVNEYKPAGSYEVNFNASGLTSGIYFYKIQAESFIDTKKMILMK